jgi:hypothetical protein
MLISFLGSVDTLVCQFIFFLTEQALLQWVKYSSSSCFWCCRYGNANVWKIFTDLFDYFPLTALVRFLGSYFPFWDMPLAITQFDLGLGEKGSKVLLQPAIMRDRLYLQIWTEKTRFKLELLLKRTEGANSSLDPSCSILLCSCSLWTFPEGNLWTKMSQNLCGLTFFVCVYHTLLLLAWASNWTPSEIGRNLCTSNDRQVENFGIKSLWWVPLHQKLWFSS